MPFWVISYDITDDKRRRRVCTILEGCGRRAQYSVFECDLDSEKVDRLEARLKREINPQEDDIRFYPLNVADIKRVRLLGVAELRRARPVYFVERNPLPQRPPNSDDPF